MKKIAKTHSRYSSNSSFQFVEDKDEYPTKVSKVLENEKQLENIIQKATL